MRKRIVFLFAATALLLSCGSRPGKTQQPASRSFPMAEIPAMLSDPADRMAWISEHFWDPFTRPGESFPCDSALVNGVPKEELEQAMGIYATLLQEVPPADAQKGAKALLGRMEAFQEAHPESNLFAELQRLMEFYFYDPNSPVRNEEIYLPFVSGLAESAFVDPARRPAYEWTARMCALNRPGTPAADFVFIDTKGRQHRFYDIQADWTLLVFGNPDCNACKDLTEEIEADDYLNGLLRSGTLKVVDIYIDEDIDAWKSRISDYPKTWINGYDPNHIIREDLIYNVRALPSLYLLDREKRVVLKDATTQQVFNAL